MVIGGLIGFLIGILFGYAQEVAWPTLFWRASVAALVAGLLLRWWGRIWIHGFHESNEQRMAIEAAMQPPLARGPKK